MLCLSDERRGSMRRPEYPWNLAFARLDAAEARICIPANAAAKFAPVRQYFVVVSRLGDGLAWYVLLAALPLSFGPSAAWASAHLGLTALFNVWLYRHLKLRFVRERPFAANRGVSAMTTPLDRYSFPSGHTLHATAFSTMVAAYFPELLWIVLPFAASVALSRVILGLHYPSDVLAGALIGALTARLSLAIGGFVGSVPA